MSGFKQVLGKVGRTALAAAGDVAKAAVIDVGNAYQEVLLQDSPLRGLRDDGLEATEANAAKQPWPGLSGEALGPEPETSRDPWELMQLDSGATIDAEYTEIEETPQIEHQPDQGGPDIG
jgi:hypothetical protein